MRLLLMVSQAWNDFRTMMPSAWNNQNVTVDIASETRTFFRLRHFFSRRSIFSLVFCFFRRSFFFLRITCNRSELNFHIHVFGAIYNSISLIFWKRFINLKWNINGKYVISATTTAITTEKKERNEAWRFNEMKMKKSLKFSRSLELISAALLMLIISHFFSVLSQNWAERDEKRTNFRDH